MFEIISPTQNMDVMNPSKADVIEHPNQNTKTKRLALILVAVNDEMRVISISFLSPFCHNSMRAQQFSTSKCGQKIIRPTFPNLPRAYLIRTENGRSNLP